MKKNKNGITLIALVITIIVLLVVAGVSISLVTGENGVLSQAEKASSTYNVAAAKEQANMKAAGYVSEYMEKVYVGNDMTVGSMTTGEYVLSLINGEEDGNYRYSVSGNTITVTDKTTGEALASGTIGDNGEISWSDTVASGGNNSNTPYYPKPTTPSEIIESAVNYGVAYDDESVKNTGGYDDESYEEDVDLGDSGWEIFYYDDNDVYLITRGWINADDIGLDLSEYNGVEATNGTVTGDFAASNWETKYPAVKANLLSKTLSYANGRLTANYTSTYDNMKATQWLLDSSVWNEDYVVSEKADWAIGAPTLELLAMSYDKRKELTGSNSEYEKMKTPKNTGYDSVFIRFFTGPYTAYSWPMACPSSHGNKYVRVLHPNGDNSWSMDIGGIVHDLRPVVHLKAKFSQLRWDTANNCYTIP